MAQWNLAATARRDFADLIDSLSPEQLETQSLCGEWTSFGVLTHVTSFVETSFPRFMATVIGSGFNFDKASVAMAARLADRSASDLTAILRAKGTKSAALPMFPEEMTVADCAIHTIDVRRPTGAEGSLDEAVLRASLDFLTTHKMATTMVDRRPIEAVALEATDLDWSFGSGEQITGSAEDLLLGLANRPLPDGLSGDGLNRWS